MFGFVTDIGRQIGREASRGAKGLYDVTKTVVNTTVDTVKAVNSTLTGIIPRPFDGTVSDEKAYLLKLDVDTISIADYTHVVRNIEDLMVLGEKRWLLKHNFIEKDCSFGKGEVIGKYRVCVYPVI